MCCGMGRIFGGAQAGFLADDSRIALSAAAFPDHGEFCFSGVERFLQGCLWCSGIPVELFSEPCDFLQKGCFRWENAGISEDLISGAHGGRFSEIRIEVEGCAVEVGDCGFPVGQGGRDAFLGDAFEWRHAA